MRVGRFLLSAGLLTVLAACNDKVIHSNPYDPDAPVALQVKGKLAGRVVAEAAFAPDSLQVQIEGTTPRGDAVQGVEVAISVDGQRADFSADLPRGTYRVKVSAPGFDPVDRFGITVTPEETTDAGTFELRAGRGMVQGRVVARSGSSDAAAPLDTRVTLIRLVQPFAAPATGADCAAPGAEEAVFATLKADGTFVALGLAAGPYLATAERDGFVPAMSSASVEVKAGEMADVGTLVLLSADQIARIRPPANPKASPSAIATNSLEMSVEVAVPPLYNGMRFSEDPTFSDAARGDTDFVQAQESRAWSLPPGEGLRKLFVQFRSALCSFSPTYEASVLVDTTPPTVRAPSLASGAACTNVPLVSLRIDGEDPCSAGLCAGLYQMQVSVDGALDDEPWVDFDTQYPVDLGSDGARKILVALRDAAGNTSTTAAEASVKVNTAGPQVGTPAISVNDGATLVRSLTCTLSFQATGATEVEVGNSAGLDGTAFQPLPPGGRLEWRLAEGSDGVRTVHARFKDACGNFTQEFAQTLTLDRSARIRGSVRLEDAADPAGTVVSVWRLEAASGSYLDTGLTAVAGSDGGFVVSGLTAGTYRLDFSHPGYAARTLAGLVLAEGGEALPPELTLAAARGDLAGRATLEGETNHDGIRVEAAPGLVTYTDPSGAYLFNGLKVGSYSPSAQKGTAFQQAVASAPVKVTEAAVATAADLVLHPVPGSLHGLAKLQGRSVHSGIAIAATGLSVAGSKQTAATTTDDAGAFSLAGLTAGTWRLTLTSLGFQTVTLAEAVLGPADDLDLGTVTLSPATGSVEGSAKLANATNHEGIRVAVQQAGVEQQATFTAPNGSYRFASVPVGTYSVVATKGGYRRQSESPVVVEAERTTTVATLGLTVQAGDVWLEDGVGQTLGDATSLAQIRVRGTYPNAVEGRFCESPSIQPHLGGDPSTFTLADCAWVGLTYSGGVGTPWDAMPLSWRTSPCPRAGDPLAVCDGAKTAYVRVRDSDGAESDWFELPVVLDRRAPKGVVVIEPDSATILAGAIANGGAAYSRSTTVRVLVSTSEDRSGVAAGDAVSGLAGAWLYRSPTDAAPVPLVVGEGESMVDGVNLPGGADGSRSLYLKVTDRAGNSSVADLSAVSCPDPRSAALPGACDTVFVDTTPPPSVAFAINPLLPDDFTQGAAYATSPVVRLGLDSTLTGKPEDQAVEITLSNDSSFVTGVVQPLAGPKTVLSWVLSPGDGPKTVYAKVRDAAGNLSARFEASVQLVTTVPEIPLLYPVGAYTRSSKPTLVFAPVSGADTYRLQLCDVATFTGANLLEIPSLAASSYVPASALHEGTWYWRVKARNAAGLESAFSPADVFTVDTIAPSVPAPYAVPSPTKLSRPTLSWTSVTDAAAYRIDLDTAALFNSGPGGTPLRSATTPGVALTPDILADGTWHWRVQAVDAAGNASAFAVASSFQVMTQPPANPALLAPADDVLLAEAAVAFSWSAPAGAVSYLLDLSSSPTFASFERTTATFTSRSLTLSDGTWYWRVLAKDAADNVSDSGSAPVRRVRIDTVHPPVPTLTAVPTPSNLAKPTLSWSAVSGATSYQLTLDGATTSQAATSFTPAANLADGTHVWTVAALDAAGNRSDDAPPQSFVIKTLPPAAPTLVAYAPNPSGVASPTVSWSGVADAANYSVQWDKVATFAGPDFGGATTTSTSNTLPLLTDGLWYWRVQAKDSVGNASAWSTTGSFTRDTAAPANPALGTPANAALVASRTIVFTWAAVSDAAAYLVDSSQSPTLATYDRQETSFTTRGVTVSAEGDWYWRVLARDAAGNVSPVAGAPIRRVQIDTVPPATPVLTTVLSPTNNPAPVLAWSAVAGAAGYSVTLDGVSSSVVAISFTPGSALADGSHTWTAAALDAAGNRSADAPAQSFLVDSTPPAVPSIIPYAPNPTNVATPSVSWSGVAEAASYSVQWDKVATFNGTSLGSATTSSTSYPLPLGSDGTWYWRVRAADSVGNASAWSATGSLDRDTAPPANPALVAPAANALSATRTVTLTWSAVAGVASYLVDVSQSAALATYERAETTLTSRTIVFSADGDWYWRVLSKNLAGTLSTVASAPIRKLTIDSSVPASPVLTAVPSPTNNPRPTLTWSAVSGAADYLVTLDGVATAVTATNFTPAATLAETTHVWTVAARTAAGNRGADAPPQGFLVDVTPPGVASASTRLNGQDKSGPSTTLTRGSVVSVALTGFPDADIASMRVWESTQAEPTTWQAYSVWFPWVLSSPDGAKILNVKVRDAAGNVAGPVAGSITLDTAAPQVVSVALNQKPYATAPAVTMAFTVLGATEMRLSERSDFTGASYGAYSASGSLTFTGADGLKVAYVQFRDAAGNETAILSDLTTLDTSAPYAPFLSINGGAASTVFALVSLSLSAVGADEMHLWGGVNDTGWVPYQPSRSDNLLSGGGLKTLNVQFRDRAGNLSAIAPASIDYQPPPAPVGVMAAGGAGKISLTWGASSGATGYDVLRSAASGGPYASIGTPVGTSWDDSSVTPGVTYYYVVRATSPAGASANSAQVSASTVPAAPTGLTAKAGAHRIGLSWSVTAGTTGYRVLRSTLPGGPFGQVGTPTANSYLDSGLPDATTYYYVVRAVNVSGESTDSAVASATTVPLEVCTSNASGNSVADFLASSSGNVSPQRSFGSQTGLSTPRGVAVDATNNEVYVANAATNTISVYPRGTASGNVAPTRVLAGSLTNLSEPTGLAVDPINNELFVTSPSGNKVLVFARNASGNTGPIRVLTGGLSSPRGVWVDTTNNELAVANTTGGGKLTFHSRTAGGATLPLRSFTMPNSTDGCTWWMYENFMGVAVDPVNNEAWVSGYESYSFGCDCATGDPCTGQSSQGFLRAFNRTTGVVQRTIWGASTGLDVPAITGVGVNTANGEVYFVNETLGSLVTHGRTSNGNVAPLRTLSGAATGLSTLGGLAYDSGRLELVTAASGSNALLVHARTASGNTAPLRSVAYGGNLSAPRAMALSFERDELFVANTGGSTIGVFPRGSTGDAVPTRVISGANTGLTSIQGLALNPATSELFVSDGASIKVFALAASGNVAPLRTISGAATNLDFGPRGIAVSAARGEVAVALASNAATAIFDVSASGNATPKHLLGGGAALATTGLSTPSGVLIDDANQELWVSCTGNNSLRVFAVDAEGATAPKRPAIQGAVSTGLSSPRNLVLDLIAGQLYVANGGDHSIRVFNRLGSGDVPPLRTIQGAATSLAEPSGLTECN
ncbi:MAG TPA: Ig-like domain-containing protein [Myxococcales bacterium]|jgi:hypothetical protein